MWKAKRKDKLSEILVLGEEYPIFPVCKVEQLLIGGIYISVPSGKNIMAEVRQRTV